MDQTPSPNEDSDLIRWIIKYPIWMKQIGLLFDPRVGNKRGNVLDTMIPRATTKWPKKPNQTNKQKTKTINPRKQNH